MAPGNLTEMCPYCKVDLEQNTTMSCACKMSPNANKTVHAVVDLSKLSPGQLSTHLAGS